MTEWRRTEEDAAPRRNPGPSETVAQLRVRARPAVVRKLVELGEVTPEQARAAGVDADDVVPAPGRVDG